MSEVLVDVVPTARGLVAAWIPPFDPCGIVTPPGDLAALKHLASEAARNSLGNDAGHASFLEVGSWAGRTALVLAGALPRGITTAVYCVDHWRGSPGDNSGFLIDEYDVWDRFFANLKDKIWRTIFPCRGPSEEWARVWSWPLDLVYIDADHEYDGVKADITLWSRHVRPGGILCGHDYGVTDGVTRAVDELKPDGVLGQRVWWKRL